MKQKTRVISAFPGCGKTTFFNKTKLNVLDSDSSTFDKADFPRNYIEHIQYNMGNVDIIFVSSHAEVRTAMHDAGIDFIVFHPALECKDEYLQRYKDRGSPPGFISLLDRMWEDWITELVEIEDEFNTFELGPEQYIADKI